MHTKPSVCIVGAGAAGLWCALRLVERGWSGPELCIVEPDAKSGDDHTWSYWLREPILPDEVEKRAYWHVELAADGRRERFETAPYWYESLRSSHFYAYAKRVLAKASVRWIAGHVEALAEYANEKVEVRVGDGAGRTTLLDVDYVLDSRPPRIDVHDPRYLSTLQHFGGQFVRCASPVLDPGSAVFMDFVAAEGEVAFLYVLPQSTTEALIEIAVFGKEVWARERYDEAIARYVAGRYRSDGAAAAYEVLDAEYGAIPMTDQPLWNESTARIWKVGTAGGWVQPSSGYAFTRCARFATDVAASLESRRPRPWRPSAVQQVFNSTMLGYLIDRPEAAGQVFLSLFERNGAPRTFAFLDEDGDAAAAVKLMWNSPRREFARRAVTETARRLLGAK